MQLRKNDTLQPIKEMTILLQNIWMDLADITIMILRI